VMDVPVVAAAGLKGDVHQTVLAAEGSQVAVTDEILGVGGIQLTLRPHVKIYVLFHVLLCINVRYCQEQRNDGCYSYHFHGCKVTKKSTTPAYPIYGFFCTNYGKQFIHLPLYTGKKKNIAARAAFRLNHLFPNNLIAPMFVRNSALTQPQPCRNPAASHCCPYAKTLRHLNTTQSKKRFK